MPRPAQRRRPPPRPAVATCLRSPLAAFLLLDSAMQVVDGRRMAPMPAGSAHDPREGGTPAGPADGGAPLSTIPGPAPRLGLSRRSSSGSLSNRGRSASPPPPQLPHPGKQDRMLPAQASVNPALMLPHLAAALCFNALPVHARLQACFPRTAGVPRSPSPSTICIRLCLLSWSAARRRPQVGST